jgi:hypothetical protein
MKNLLLPALLLAIQSWSGEIRFANECVVLHEVQIANESWGGWDFPDSVLKNRKLRYYEPIDDQVYPKEIEPNARMDLKLRYWLPNDYCVKLKESLIEAKDAKDRRFPADSEKVSESIRYCDSLNLCLEMRVLGMEKRFLFLKDVGSGKCYRVDKWFYSWSDAVRIHAIMQRIKLLDTEKESLQSKLDELNGG